MDKTLKAEFQQWVSQESVWDDVLFMGNASAQPVLKNAVVEPMAAVAIVVKAGVAPLPEAPLSGTKAERLQALYERYKGCVACDLGPTRIKFVFGVGSPEAQVLFIGEGPGYEEDRRGEPFVGKAGQLLDKILESIGLSRSTNVYIANIVKCHPMTDPQTPEARGNDRPPTPDEVGTCSPILRHQIAILQPRVIVTLGSPSTKAILATTEGITKLRGTPVPFDVDRFFAPDAATQKMAAPPIPAETLDALRTTQVLPTYHPAALLRNPDLKKDVWTDMKLLRELLSAL